MPRDELRQPLRKRSLKERLWARRPSAFAMTAGSLVALFVTGGMWVSRIPHPFAGEPIVVASIPPPQELQTSSTTPARQLEPEATESQSPEDVIDENAGIAENSGAGEPVEEPAYMKEAAIIVSPNRPMKSAPHRRRDGRSCLRGRFRGFPSAERSPSTSIRR